LIANKQKLSEKAIENLRRNEELRNKDIKFIKLQSGEKATLHFNAEKIEPAENEFENKKVTRYQYTVVDANDPEQQEKYFTVSKRTSQIIDAHLIEGKTLLKIQRIGLGTDTQYIITPA
jgi:hypothetical protein